MTARRGLCWTHGRRVPLLWTDRGPGDGPSRGWSCRAVVAGASGLLLGSLLYLTHALVIYGPASYRGMARDEATQTVWRERSARRRALSQAGRESKTARR